MNLPIYGLKTPERHLIMMSEAPKKRFVFVMRAYDKEDNLLFECSEGKKLTIAIEEDGFFSGKMCAPGKVETLDWRFCKLPLDSAEEIEANLRHVIRVEIDIHSAFYGIGKRLESWKLRCTGPSKYIKKVDDDLCDLTVFFKTSDYEYIPGEPIPKE